MTTEIVEKPLEPARLAARTVVVPTPAEISAVVGPLFNDVAAAIERAGGTPGLPVAVYQMVTDGLRAVIGFAYDGDPPADLEIVDLPAVEKATCAVHHGSVERIGALWQELHGAIAARGLVPTGPGREVYLVSDPVDDDSRWVTELQQPVAPA